MLQSIKSLALAGLLAAGTLGSVVTAPQAYAQVNDREQFFPVLVYRTGAYGPNGNPWANGYVDYLKLTNERGGLNGVTITYEECEFGYATDRGVECYERLKGRNGGATVFQPLSTGVTFAMTDKAQVDQIPIITAGYGRSESADGEVFKWNFPLLGSYWTGADVMIQHLAQQNGGFDALRGKKITLIYHDSPFGKEPIPLLERRAEMHGFQLNLIPVPHPGVEQKSAWLQVRQQRPDYVLLWGWGVMNNTALKEAQATGFPRERMLGIWWAGAEPDVTGVEAGARGYNALGIQHGVHRDAPVTREILEKLHDRGQGTGPREEVGSVLYMRGMLSAMLAVEGVKRAQERWGNTRMTGVQVRWGLENLDLTQDKLNALGFEGIMRPVKTSCQDHMGASWARVQTWNGSAWEFSSDWFEADQSVVGPMVREAADRYAAEKGITRRTAAECAE